MLDLTTASYRKDIIKISVASIKCPFIKWYEKVTQSLFTSLQSTMKISEQCEKSTKKLTINTPGGWKWRRTFDFVATFKQISLISTDCPYVCVADFEQVNTGYDAN